MRAMTDSVQQPATSLGVSIVLYQSDIAGLAALLESLDSAIQHARGAGVLGEVDISIVDNSLDDHYRRQVQALIESSTVHDASALVINAHNAGFGAAHNQILRKSPCRYHLVLNPDVALDPDALTVGLTALETDTSTELVSPFVQGPNREQEFLCKRYPTVWVLLLRAFGPAALKSRFDADLASYECRDLCSGTDPAEVPLVSGCFMLGRTQSMQDIGGFDEAFFLYFEDFDLSQRLSMRGRLLYLPQMRIRHGGGYAARKGLRHIAMFVASGVRFFNRYGWRWV